MENQLIGKIKIKYLPKRLNNTRERQRESKKSEAKQEKARRNATKQQEQQQLKAFSSGCSRCSFAVFQQFSTFSLTSYLSVVVLHLSFGPCMRVQGELNQLTLGANKLTCKHFTATAVASLFLSLSLTSPFPSTLSRVSHSFSAFEVQFSDATDFFLACFSSISVCVCVGVPVVGVRVCMCVW